MKKIFITLLRITRSEQMGLVVLFVLVLIVLFAPRFTLPEEPPPFAFEVLERQIDSAFTLPAASGASIRDKRERPAAPSGGAARPAASGSATSAERRINYVPYVKPQPPAVSVDLNRADTLQLQQISGIGGYFARRIVEYRERLGGYVDLGQLLEIRGIDEDRVLRWQKALRVDLAAVRRLNLSTATEEELRKHPYIGFYAARGILAFRKTGAQVNLEALVANHVLGEDAAQRLKAYCE